jgi:hypothetical protein
MFYDFLYDFLYTIPWIHSYVISYTISYYYYYDSYTTSHVFLNIIGVLETGGDIIVQRIMLASFIPKSLLFFLVLYTVLGRRICLSNIYNTSSL